MMQIGDQVIRAQLHTDIQVFWADTKDILDDPPFEPTAVEDLPRAFIQLSDQLRPQRNTGTAGMGEVSIPHVYTLTRQALWPTGDTTIEAEKVTQANAALAVLTAGTRYAGGVRNVTGINIQGFDVSFDEQTEGIYELSIMFSVEVVTGA